MTQQISLVRLVLVASLTIVATYAAPISTTSQAEVSSKPFFLYKHQHITTIFNSYSHIQLIDSYNHIARIFFKNKLI